MPRRRERVSDANEVGREATAILGKASHDKHIEAIVSSFQTLRSDGEVTLLSELKGILRSRGYADVETDPSPHAALVFGRLG